MPKSLRWYLAGGLFAVTGILCTVIGDHARTHEIWAEAATDAKKNYDEKTDGVHGLSGE